MWFFNVYIFLWLCLENLIIGCFQITLFKDNLCLRDIMSLFRVKWLIYCVRGSVCDRFFCLGSEYLITVSLSGTFPPRIREFKEKQPSKSVVEFFFIVFFQFSNKLLSTVFEVEGKLFGIYVVSLFCVSTFDRRSHFR